MINKEAIGLLEDYCKWCNAQGGQCQLSLDGCAVGEALALLKEQPEPKCKICGDKKPENYTQWLIEVREEDKFLGHGVIKRTTNQKRELYKMYLESFHPCAACKEQPPASEFTKEIRDYIADFIYAEQHGVAMQHKPRCLERDIIETCARLDASEASRGELVEALGKYGDHEPGCIKGDACTCGLKAAIKKAEK